MSDVSYSRDEIIGILVRRGYESAASEILGAALRIHHDKGDFSRDIIVHFSESSLQRGHMLSRRLSRKT